MGVNRAGFAITDNRIAEEAAKQEIIRQYFRYRCEYTMGFTDKETVQRVELFVKDFKLEPEYRRAVAPARRLQGWQKKTKKAMKESTVVLSS